MPFNRVAVISNGPSAIEYEQSDGEYCRVIGVTGAAAKWKCDWWVFCDWDVLTKFEPIGNPFLFIPAILPETLKGFEPHNYDKYTRYSHVKFHETVKVPEWPDPEHSKWSAYSGCAALGLVYYLKPKRVDVYGVDMAGASDCHGEDRPDFRLDGRWKDEREYWSKWMTILQGEGIQVVHGKDDTA